MFQIGHAYIINIEPKNLGGEGSAFWGFSPQSPPPPNAYTFAIIIAWRLAPPPPNAYTLAIIIVQRSYTYILYYYLTSFSILY